MKTVSRLSGRRSGILAVAAACSVGGLVTFDSSSAQVTAPAPRPNIVFVLTDDLNKNLVRFMPRVRAMERNGVSFSNYTVSDSLCCPSRASIFTGDYPHNTGVFTNSGSDGGHETFVRNGNEPRSFALALQHAGYRTAMMGKYINGYKPGKTSSVTPPGWNEWDVVGGHGPFGFNYRMAHNGGVQRYRHRPRDYVTDVLSRKATRFISKAARSGSPFFLEVATFAPHTPYIPAPRDARKLRKVTAPRTPAFNRLPQHPPRWLSGKELLTKKERKRIDRDFRLRARQVLSVDQMIGAIKHALAKARVTKNTVLVFSSDNGYHMGEYRLNPGKQTAFDTDIRVPLVVQGPGIAHGRVSPHVVQNIDFAPTFEELAGLAPSQERDGISFARLLRAHPPSNWPDLALIEHRGTYQDPTDPDLPQPGSGNPPGYQALRSRSFTYVSYVNGDREYYDRSQDPFQLNNIYASLSAQRRAELEDILTELKRCSGATACTSARSATAG